MTEREATDAEMLAAVERWARARGIFRLRHQTIKRYGPRPACPWLALRITVGVVEIHHWDMATPWLVDPHTALLWALSVEAGVTVDAGACGWCGGEVMVDSGGVTPWGEGIDIPCSACRAKPGREIVEAARLLLDAAPRPNADLSKPAKYGRAKCSGCGYSIATTRAGLIRSHTGPGPGSRCSGSKQRPDTVARDHVDVCATKLQTLGDPLGLWYALWLAGKRDHTADTVERLNAVALRHELINYPGQSDDRTDAVTQRTEPIECERCDGTGRVTTYRASVGWGETDMEVPGPGLPSGVTTDCPDCNGRGHVRSND